MSSAPTEWLDSSIATNPPPPPPPLPVPLEVQAEEACQDPTCVKCATTGVGAVATAGARALCEAIGVNYDEVNKHVKAHYRHIVSQVFSAMSEELLTQGLAKDPTTDA